jgi:hypothetical protein
MAKLPAVYLLECLTAPPGFHLQCLVGTTYNLHPNIVMSIMVAASIHSSGNSDFELEDCSKEEILFAIRESESKALLFCDHHGPLDGNGVFSPHEALILNSVIKKEGRQTSTGGSLHAKFMLVLFKNARDEYIARVFVGSKNLTTATFQEFGLVASLEQASAADKFTSSVADYLAYLRDFEGAGVTSPGKLRPLMQAIGILKKNRFCCTLPEAQLHWQGRDLRPGKARTWVPLGESARQWFKQGTPTEVFVHSPWTRKAAVAHLLSLCGDKAIMRIKCMDEQRLSTLESPRVFYHLYQGNQDRLPSLASHAKVYLFKFGKQAVVAFGSANLTMDGWGTDGYLCRPNSEMMITLPGTYAQFIELAGITGRSLSEKVPQAPTTTEKDRMRDYLCSIQVGLDYDTERKQLRYTFTTSASPILGLDNIEVVNDLVEMHDGLDQFKVFLGPEIPSLAYVQWDSTLLYLISPLLRLREQRTGEEIHLILDLDLSFFSGRAQLKCLSFSTHDFIDSLSKLMEINLGRGVHSSAGQAKGKVSAFLRGLRLERYIYRMARLRKNNMEEFFARMGRVDRLLTMLPADMALQESEFQAAIQAILRSHEVLRAA